MTQPRKATQSTAPPSAASDARPTLGSDRATGPTMCRMATRELSIEQAEQQARALLDARIESVRRLVTQRQRLADLHEQVAEAEREDVRLYSAALSDGWTADELRRLGLSEPEKKARGRRRSAPRRTDSPAPADSGSDQSDPA